MTLQMASAPFWNIRVGGGKQEKYVAMLRKSMNSDQTVVSSEKRHLSMGQYLFRNRKNARGIELAGYTNSKASVRGLTSCEFFLVQGAQNSKPWPSDTSSRSLSTPAPAAKCPIKTQFQWVPQVPKGTTSVFRVYHMSFQTLSFTWSFRPKGVSPRLEFYT